MTALGVYDAGASDEAHPTNRGMKMAYMFVRTGVLDYDTFRDAFDDAEDMRQSAGSTGNVVFQSADEPNEVTVQVEFPTVEAAKAFALSQELRDAMLRARVQGPPRIWFVNDT